MKFKSVRRAIGIGLLLLATSCGKGEIFGPQSSIPPDLQALANCVANQLFLGDLNPAQVANACTAPMDQTFADLWNFLVDALLKGGKLTPSNATTAHTNMSNTKLVGAP
jgi:hypothetical protein